MNLENRMPSMEIKYYQERQDIKALCVKIKKIMINRITFENSNNVLKCLLDFFF